MEQRDLYIRLTDPSGKHKDVINHHRVWDSERFLASQFKTYDGPNTPDKDRRIVTVSNEIDYRSFKKGSLKC